MTRAIYRFKRTKPRRGFDAAYEVWRRSDDVLLGTVQRYGDLGLRSGTNTVFEPYTRDGQHLYCLGVTRAAAAEVLSQALPTQKDSGDG